MATLSDEARQMIKDSVDVESLVRALGFRISRSTGSEVRAPCIIHGGDNPTAFSIRTDIKKWKCFTKKCEQDSTGRSDNDIIALVRRVTGKSFMEAIHYLADFSGLNLDDETLFVQDTEERRRRKDMTSYIRSVKNIQKQRNLPEITESQVAEFCYRRDDYFLRLGFSESTLDTFEVGSMIDRSGTPRATIPIRDESGVLAGMSARRTDSNAEPRYLVEYEFQKGQVLYNMHRALASGENTVLLVEGFKALWAVWESGFPNVVACMGANLSKDQVLALCTSGFTNCLIMLDGDEAGRAGTKAVEKKLRPYFNTLVLPLPEGSSPDDFSREELRDLIQLYLYSL